MEEKVGFASLYPDFVLNVVEKATGSEFSNLLRPLNSYINRVFELEDLQGDGYIAKFYRPGRWTIEAILEEHLFLGQLHDQELPVIRPVTLKNGTTLDNIDGATFALFPKCGGRSIDELDDDGWLQIGRLLGRVHQVGRIETCQSRLKMTPAVSTRLHVKYLLDNELIPAELKNRFLIISQELIDVLQPLFAHQPFQRIHGDLHSSNLIYRPGESFYMIDFDDMVVGPPVQDIWMLLPGGVDECGYEIELFLEGYETFNHFDRLSFRLVEGLRAMRYIHYMAWCAYQVVEDGKTEIIPDFGSYTYWQTEIGELVDQLEIIRDTVSGPGPLL